MFPYCLGIYYLFHIFLHKFVETPQDDKTGISIVPFKSFGFDRIKWKSGTHEAVEISCCSENVFDILGFESCLSFIELLTGVGFGKNRKLIVLLFTY